jgi:hypothetical protein
VIVEGSVDGVLDPLVELLLSGVGDVEVGEEFRAEGQVGDFVVGTDVVDLVHLALVQNCVKGICGISSEKVASGGSSVSVENDWLTSVEQQAEFRNNLCFLLAIGVLRLLYLLLTLRVLVGAVDIVASHNDNWQLERFLV